MRKDNKLRKNINRKTTTQFVEEKKIRNIFEKQQQNQDNRHFSPPKIE